MREETSGGPFTTFLRITGHISETFFCSLTVPTQPHKKKKLQIGSAGGLAVNRRNSGLSETSSEIDSAVDSPDVTDATATVSLVSNKVNMLLGV